MTLTGSPDSTGEPYPGLRSFHRDETHIFFGREGSIAQMVDRLGEHHFLAVTGLSGSGKSSLVRTGLLNGLERGLLVEAGSDWRVADFRPGGWPLSPLVAALIQALSLKFSGDEIGLIEAKLARGPMGLVDWLDEIDFPHESNLLLLVDQFEEIFRYRQGATGDDVNAFVALLLASAKERRRHVYVVITMRSDYLGDCAHFTDLAETINDGQFLTPQLTREQCREAIEGPAAVYDGKVEPALVTRMLNDMAGNPDQLPLMQHILMLMWNQSAQRDQGRPPQLTLADYERLGGIGSSGPDKDAPIGGKRLSLAARFVTIVRRVFAGAQNSQDVAVAMGATSFGRSNGALSDHADRILAELTPAQQRLAATVFRALTQGEGAGGRDVRRPTKLKNLAAIAGVAPAELIPIIEAFRAPGRNFLTPPHPASVDLESDIDITHESLIRQWAKLRQWVHEEYQSAEEYRGIERAAKHWREGRGGLLMKVDLAVAKKWRKAERPNPAWAARYGNAFGLVEQFIKKSRRSQFWRRTATAVAAIVVLSILPAFLFVTAVRLGAALPYIDPGGEFTDYNVRPRAVLQNGAALAYTPRTVPGGRVISTLGLKDALKAGVIDGSPFKLIDVLSGEHTTIPGATRLSYAGYVGTTSDPATFQDHVQQKLATDLSALTKNNRNMPLVFFCYGSQCWESYNACLRAVYLGYTNVYWYRGGISAWQEANQSLDLKSVDLAKLQLNFSNVGSNAPNVFRYVILPMFGIGSARVVAQTDPDARTLGVADLAGRAIAEVKSGHYDAAIIDYGKAIELDPKSASKYYNRGLSFAKNGDQIDAVADFDKAIALGDSGKDAYYNRGLSYAAAKDYKDAIADFSKVIELGGKNADVYYNRGLAYADNGQRNEAIADYSQAIALDANNAHVWNSRGFAYYFSRDYARSVSDFSRAIQLDPKPADYWSDRGLAYDAQQQYDNAIKDFAEAIKLDSQSYFAFLGYGLASAHKGDYADAITKFTEAIRVNSDLAYAYDGRGTAYRDSGDYTHALQDFAKAIAITPTFNVLYDPFYHRGKAYLDKADFDHAVQDFTRAIALDPRAGTYWYRGAAQLYWEKPGSAADDFAQAVKQSPSPYYAIWLHMARTRAGKDDASELAANAQKMDHGKWPWPVMALFLGTTTPDAVLTAAQSAANANAKNDQVCEGDFYVGVYQGAKGDQTAARQLLQSAAKSCPRNFFEAEMTPLELARLH